MATSNTTTPPLTLESLARARGLDPALLRSLGWTERDGAVAIPWKRADGRTAWHLRLAVEKEDGRPRWRWANGDRDQLLPYMAEHLPLWRTRGHTAVIIVESEIDAVALASAGLAAIATGGADAWQGRWWDLLQEFERVVLWLEDPKGQLLLQQLWRSRPSPDRPLFVCQSWPFGEKDPGRLLARANGQGATLFHQIVAQARPAVGVATAEALVAEIVARLGGDYTPEREAYSLCCPLHHDADPSLSVYRDRTATAPRWFYRCRGACAQERPALAQGPAEVLGGFLGIVVSRPSPTPDRRVGLPTVVVHGHIPTLAEETWAAVRACAARRPRVFARYPDGRLVRVVPARDGRLQIQDLDGRLLRHELWRAIEFVHLSTTENGAVRETPTRPPEDLVQYMLAEADPPVPTLRGIVRVPVVLADGTLLARSGYYPEAGLYADLDVEVEEIPETPAGDAVRQAVHTLLEPFCDFPLAGPADRANLLALLLTPFCLELFPPPAPFFACLAASHGLGKTLLLQAALAIALGEVAARDLPRDEDECRKAVTGILAQGLPAALFDNVTRIEGKTLAALGTAPFWEDRPLGQTTAVRYPNRTLWLFTGVNPVISTELARRLVPIFLTTYWERPWEREHFRYSPLLAWIRQHRARLVHAALVLVRHWLARGRPRPATLPAFGSYDGWVAVIGGILAAAGVDGFLANRSALHETLADQEVETVRAFCIRWWEAFQDQALAAQALLPVAQEVGLPLSGETEAGRTKSLGHWLRHRQGTVVEVPGAGPVRVTRADRDPHLRRSLWRLTPVPGSADCGFCGFSSANPEGPHATPSPRETEGREGQQESAQSAFRMGEDPEGQGHPVPPDDLPPPDPSADAPADAADAGGRSQRPHASPDGNGAGESSGRAVPDVPSFPIEVITTAEVLAQALPAIARAPVLALDLETTGDDPHRDRVRLLSLSDGDRVWVIDLFQVDPTPLWPVLAQTAQLVGHNLSFDLRFLLGLGLAPEGLAIDTMVLDQLLRADGRPRGLAEVAQEVLGLALDKTLQKSDWSGELTTAQLRYAGLDAWVTWHGARVLRDRCVEKGLEKVVALEAAALPVVAAMGSWGLPIEKERLAALVARCAQEAEDARQHLGTLLGPVDPDSPKQLREILRLRGIAVEKTDEASLAPYREDPVVAALLQYRQAARRARLFSGEDFRPHPVTGRLHPDWRLLGAPTGRMSCSHPNIQALPRDPAVRSCIRAPEGWVLVKADFSQIELRIAAELSGDERLIQAFRRGEDIHAQTARLVLGREPTPEDRQLAKGLNFGLLYGAGPATLAASLRTAYGLDVSVAEAARLREAFFRAYPVLRRWQRRLLHGEGELRTVLGRLLKPTRATDRVNYPVQGSAADGLKVALGLLRARLPQGARVVACVHDEVLVECRVEDAATVVEAVREALAEGMRTVLRRVPVVVEVGVYQDWGVTPATVAWSGPIDGREG